MRRKRNAHQQNKREEKAARRAAERAVAATVDGVTAPPASKASVDLTHHWDMANRPELRPRWFRFTARQLADVSRSISGEALVAARIAPEPDALALCCVQNVQAKVERDGGSPCYGWTLNLRVSEHGPYVFYQHHAVWRAPDETLVDVTPLTPDPRHHPLRIGRSTLFLLDASAIPTETEYGPAVLPNRFLPLGSSRALADYLARKTEEERLAPHNLAIVPG